MFEFPFSNQERFREAFISGLRELLAQPGLGGYILVHANASLDEAIFESLKAPLQDCFDELSATCKEALENGREMAGAPDDQLVFLKLMAIGFQGVQMTEFRREGEWEVQFNHIRAFRPARMTSSTVKGIHQPFDPLGFHFNKPFLRKEAFWTGELRGLQVELLYNKFPFAPLHGLLVPERSSREPQYLSHLYHLYVWSLAEELVNGLDDLGFAYNSYGAYASVNHLHFQMFQRSDPLPIEAPVWKHNGGEVDYPLDCEVYTSVREAWERLEALHNDEISYNLIYLPGRLYCLPRKPQGSYVHSNWTNGFAWHELAGGITTFSRADFDQLTAATIESEMSKLKLGSSN